MELDAYLSSLFITGLMCLGGLALMYRGFELRKQRQLMEDTPTEDVESITMGPSEVTGEVVPRAGAAAGVTPGPDHDSAELAGLDVSNTTEYDSIPDENPLPDETGECLRSPFQDERCVVVTWEIEEWDESGDSEGWRTVHEGFEGVRFDLDDGTDTLLIEPSDEAILDLEGDEFDDPVLEVSAVEDPPPRVRAYIDQHPFLSPSNQPFSEMLDVGNTHGDRRYYEALLTPGEDAYVFGTVQPRDGEDRSTVNPENAVIRSVSFDDDYDEPMFLISNKPEDQLVDDRRWVMWRVPAGALAAAAGFVGFVWLLANPVL